MKPKFIVLDGIDACGSTTHVQLLESYFKKKDLKVKITHEPTQSSIGRLIKEYLRENKGFPELDALLFASDRAQHSKLIQTWLGSDYFVISDRYVESSICYQSSSGVDINWIKEINKFALVPDIYIILDIDPKEAIKRIKKERVTIEKFEKLEFLIKVRDAFLKRAREMNYIITPTSDSIENVHSKIKKIIQNMIY